MKPVTRRRLTFVAGFAAYFAALWLLWATPVVYPLKIFVVLLHELSHALAGLATGGDIESIVLTPNEGGATFVRGGSPFLMLSAGYLGSLAWGLILLEAARAPARWLRLIVGATGGLMMAVALFFVRNIFGLVFSLAFGAALVLASRRLRPAANAALLTVLGLTSSLYALLDIRSDILQRPDAESDAHMLAQLTGIPTLVWGVLWGGIALLASIVAVRRAYLKA
jgi:hypothetical protein